MKKFIILIFLALAVPVAKAQNRPSAANFSLFQQYFNPALTAYEGSTLKTFYRDQWTGFDDAPYTFFASAELSLSQPDAAPDRRSPQPDPGQSPGVSHHLGASVWMDQFGPLQQGQYFVNYATGVRLSRKLQLRAGGAITYQVSMLNPAKMTFDQDNDGEYQALLLGDNRARKLDGNVGLVLTSDAYYLGYALQDIARGKVISGNDQLWDMYPMQHVLQAGYRKGLSDHFGLVVNGLYRYDEKLKETMEAQVKGVVSNTFWAGAGYRKDLAWTFLAGVRLGQVRIGYAREVTSGTAQSIHGGTNEVLFSYNLVPVAFEKAGRRVSIW